MNKDVKKFHYFEEAVWDRNLGHIENACQKLVAFAKVNSIRIPIFKFDENESELKRKERLHFWFARSNLEIARHIRALRTA